MKTITKLLSVLCLFGLFLACNTGHKEIITPAQDEPAPAEKSTVIYLVRHAEKATNSPTDPDLSAAGHLRAQVLIDTLSKIQLSAIYTSNYKRTRQTVAPTAQAKNLTPVVYNANDLAALAAKVMQENLNQTVLITGHSNTVLETIEAFKAKRPIAVINESDYNYLFKVTLKENKDPEVEVKRYGN